MSADRGRVGRAGRLLLGAPVLAAALIVLLTLRFLEWAVPEAGRHG